MNDSSIIEIGILRNLLRHALDACEGPSDDQVGAQELTQATLATIGEAVVITDAGGAVTALNRAAEELTGWPIREAAGRPLGEVLRLLDENREAVGPELDACLRKGRPLALAPELTLERRDGRQFAVEINTSVLRDRKGEVAGMVLAGRDVSETKLMSLQLTRAASYDGLTGLLNRQAFERQLQRVLEQAPESDPGTVLCHLDLDQFKVINDTCGHAAGDLLLQWISSLIRERVRDGDVLARLGGNEFGLLLPRASPADAEEIAAEIHCGLRDFRFVWEDRTFTVGISIGLVRISPDLKDLADLLGAADHACFLAKRRGGGRTHVWERDDVEVRRHRGQLDWLLRLQRALDEDLFLLYWQRIQPLADAAGGGRFHEVLLRMQDDDEIVHEPSEFLLAAERYGLMPEIDRWVVKRTLELLARQSGAFLAELDCCAINLSGVSIGDEAVLAAIEADLAATEVPPEKICFEITETVAVSNLERANRMIRKLSERGCRWALDDFGSGMSSYRYLHQLPVHFIKIDGHIVADLATSPLSRAMVKSINQIAHVMGVRTIAEAVNCRAMVETLREIGVDYAQGYWIAKPVPLGPGEGTG